MPFPYFSARGKTEEFPEPSAMAAHLHAARAAEPAARTLKAKRHFDMSQLRYSTVSRGAICGSSGSGETGSSRPPRFPNAASASAKNSAWPSGEAAHRHMFCAQYLPEKYPRRSEGRTPSNFSRSPITG